MMKIVNKKIKYFICFILLLMNSIMIFSEPPQAPNQLITENPYKEVKIVEANKNREHAEMKITVNKLNLKILDSYKLSDTEFYIGLKDNEILKNDEVYFISKTIEEIPDITNVNGKKIFSNLDRLKEFSEENNGFSYVQDEKFILIDKAPNGIKEFIVSKLDKNTGEIKEAYIAKDFKDTPIEKITGEIEKENNYILFNLSDEIIKELGNVESNIKIGKDFGEMFKKKTRGKRDLNTLNYKVDKENKKLLVENSGEIEELKIIILNGRDINKIYRGRRNNSSRSNFIYPSEEIIIPENTDGTKRMYLNEEFGKYGMRPQIKAITYDGQRILKKNQDRHHFVKGNIILFTNMSPVNSGGDNGPDRAYIRIGRVGGYVPNITSHTIKIELEKNGNTMEKTFYITEYPQKLINERPLTEYGINEDIQKSKDSYYNDKMNVVEYIQDKRASWSSNLGLSLVYPKNSYYNKLEIIKKRNVNFIENNIYGKLETLGYKGVSVGGFSGTTQIIGALTGTYKIFFSRKSNGIVKLELDGRLIELAKNSINTYDKLIGGKFISHTLDETNIKYDYSELTNIINTFTPTSDVKKYMTFIGRSLLNISPSGKQQRLSKQRNSSEIGMSLPLNGNSSTKDKFLENIGIDLSDFKYGELENGKFTYEGVDLKNYSGEIQIKVNNNKKLSGNGKIDITTQGIGELKAYTSDMILELSGDYINTKSFKNKNILTNATIVINGVSNYIGNSSIVENLIFKNDKYEIILSDGNFKIKKLKNINFDDNIKIIYKYKEAILGEFNLKLENIVPKLLCNSNITFDSNNFTMLSNSINDFYGNIILYPTSFTNLNAKIGVLDETNKIVNDNRKNGQFKQIKIAGFIYPLKTSDLGKIIKVTVGTISREIKLGTEIDPTPTASFDLQGLRVEIDYGNINDYNGGMYLNFRNWDKEAKEFNIIVELPDAINEYNVKIPEFNPENYYDKNILQTAPTQIVYNTETLKGFFIRDHSGNIQLKFNIGTKDYDIKGLGINSEMYNLRLKIPKNITLDVRDTFGNVQNLAFKTSISDVVGISREDINYYYIYPNNDGVGTKDSKMKGIVTLKSLFKNINSVSSIEGRNLNLISIGSISDRGEKQRIIINNINATIELANFNETIDVSSLKINEKKYTTNGYYGLIQDVNKLVMKTMEGNKIFETTFKNLKINKEQILEAGVSIKYEETKNNFEFIKEKGLNYNKKLNLEVQTSKGQLLYIISINLINDIGFEILPGKGVLEFGNFFPGTVRKAENLIEFKNPNNSKISIKLKENNQNYMVKTDVSSPNDNQKILLSELTLGELNTGITNLINTFKISGKATTLKSTEAGTYRGNLDVEITIEP